ncbi:hypothetical protein DICPUDRAFT_149019 [Dictyostelium purpureum]|uniref:Uncharacterized protein n=1 Tax=Dictyostelium purpureum TaxID=5786 RepID=F0ZCL6_DICPU|nr:uncharacterized protein DICPUDRAFT_149019 [Dictyostelium purpureum]EGC38290.1 hypothetical protein DICPUDRAFT_149019 [Dictyostelium purpureum]|eukprot:XP_003285151.1 hypothetical protein DICPUDRAFT_149019 [Dictyostelium purpureum]
MKSGVVIHIYFPIGFATFWDFIFVFDVSENSFNALLCRHSKRSNPSSIFNYHEEIFDRCNHLIDLFSGK